ncbi:MAG: hypothetical protein RIS47_225, partial [Bacteroidota bacterium]
MKSKTRITIKLRLHGTAVGVFVILLIIGLSIGYYIQKSLHYNQILQSMQLLRYEQVAIQKSEAEFLLTECNRAGFYQEMKSELLDSIYLKIQLIQKQILQLHNDEIIRGLGFEIQLNSLSNGFANFDSLIHKLANSVYRRGFKDSGTIGEMRSEIHIFENMVVGTNDYRLQTMMLLLRRHEKDYLLRRETIYIDKFNNQCDILERILRLSKSSNLLWPHFLAYKQKFAEVC